MSVETNLSGLQTTDSSSVQQDPLVVERVALLPPSLDSHESALLDPEEIARRLFIPPDETTVAKREKEEEHSPVRVDIDTPPAPVPTSAVRHSFSDLPENLQIVIFHHLNLPSSASAARVCRDWNRLNTYPFGQLPIRGLVWIDRLQPCLSPQTHRSLCFAALHHDSKPALLSGFDPERYFSSTLPPSIAERFLRTDAVEKTVAHGKGLLQLELKADPHLKEILDTVIAAEREFGLAYQPFYHSLNTTVFLLGQSVKSLLMIMNMGESVTEQACLFSPIQWLRFPQTADSPFPETVDEFLDKYPMPKAVKDGGEYDDHHDEIKKWLLAVSPFLFSNFATAGESTWELFLTNRSVYPPDPKSFFNKLCDHFHLLPVPSVRAKYAEEFSELLGMGTNSASVFLRRSRPAERREIPYGDRGNRDYGILLQILVPKPLVDRIVYPCAEYGIPGKHRGKTMSQVFRTVSQDPLSSENIAVQGRMMTRPLVTRGNGIRVFNYGHTAFFQSPSGRMFLGDLERFMFRVLWESRTV
jgi:hypothetical protein